MGGTSHDGAAFLWSYHHPMSAPTHTNRLARETSPYLLQHQHNPVDWYAWGDEAFAAARAQDKPIFLSVGYSTCYWCHVMERQCFENEAIAKLMNDAFVNIKVDREERPDVDQLYMIAVQIMTRHGGWPMSVWLTPDLKPFYAGTYFPPTDAYGRPGFPTLIDALDDAWKTRRDEIEKSASEMTRAIGVAAATSDAPVALSSETIERLILRSTADYDRDHGGFGDAPKFPRQTLLRLLLSVIETQSLPANERERVAKMLTHTLDAMADGGIRDHLGGGFHRYSTDAQWLVPHFEIMLYDQAMLAPIYAQAARLFDNPRYARVARGICEFVLREMSGKSGEFYTALDAEVDHREGLNYLWTRDQIQEVLGQEATRFTALYGLDDGPNFADPHHGNGTPDANILFLPNGPGADEDDPLVVEMREKLRLARNKRKQPLLDTKVICAWNARMISALSSCARELQEPRYLDAAIRGADFLLRKHRDTAGNLLRTSRDGVAKHAATLEDYSYLSHALLDLHASTRDARWEREATRLADAMLDRFGDPANGGLFFTAIDSKDLIVRQRVATDSPLPSGNAIAAFSLHQMGRTDRARAIVESFGRQLNDYAESMSALLHAALLIVSHPAYDHRIDGPPPSKAGESDEIVHCVARRDGDRRVVVRAIIAPGFHLFDTNVDPSLGLHATRLRVVGARADDVSFIDYPPGKQLNLPFGPSLTGYEMDVEIVVAFKRPLDPGEAVPLTLSFQACDHRVCLRPVVKELTAEAQ